MFLRFGLVGWLLVSLCLLVVACAQAQPRPSSTSGVIIDLEAASITAARRFSVRDTAGSIQTFAVAEDATDEDGRPLNASHLREHMINGDQVTVEFRREADRLVAQRVSHL